MIARHSWPSTSSMSDGIFNVPTPVNEPVRTYAPGTRDREELTQALAARTARTVEIPVRIGSEEILTGNTVQVVQPHAHKRSLATLHKAGPAEIARAVSNATATAASWRRMPFVERASIFLRAAELLAGPWRQRVNAICMLNQSKTSHQAEIDAVCELVDFFRFNVAFAERIYREQPQSSSGVWNRSEYRALDGYVLAIAPFNFLSIAVNLPAAPALMGNTVVWKPATSIAAASWVCYELLREAGLPDGVINFVATDGPSVAPALDNENLAGIHFTGSTNTFQSLWRTVANNLPRYRTFPRLVGETGGKDFILAHPSADVQGLVTAIVRGGYEYQGQKCSAASRVYVPRSLWAQVRDGVADQLKTVRMGDVSEFGNFVGAVIDRKAFDSIKSYVDLAKSSANIVAGGGYDDREGFFIQPTFCEVSDPKHRLMAEEIFGPVVTAHVYDDASWTEALKFVDETSPYALTGAIFSRDRNAIRDAHEHLSHAAGNFYVNDKPTGAVVGQQPFGGGRASGTNDKAGSMWNLIRWTSPRTVKETFSPAHDYRYPFLG